MALFVSLPRPLVRTLALKSPRSPPSPFIPLRRSQKDQCIGRCSRCQPTVQLLLYHCAFGSTFSTTGSLLRCRRTPFSCPVNGSPWPSSHQFWWLLCRLPGERLILVSLLDVDLLDSFGLLVRGDSFFLLPFSVPSSSSFSRFCERVWNRVIDRCWRGLVFGWIFGCCWLESDRPDRVTPRIPSAEVAVENISKVSEGFRNFRQQFLR